MCVKRVEKKKILGRHNKQTFLKKSVEVHTFAKWLFSYFLKNAKAATRGVL